MSEMKNFPRMSVAFSFVLFLAGVVPGCATKQSDIVVARIGDGVITLPEYENLYLKSSGTREQAVSSTQEEREKFLDLMTRFKLKLADAYRNGLDRNPEVIKEINQYKGSLAASFLTEREVTAPGTRQMFDRRQEEIRGMHILFKLPTTESESTEVYQRIDEVMARLNAGEDFSKLAVEFSTDPTVQQNKGDLYYFTAGQMVTPFEDAAYAMKVGELSTMPVRSQYGLHIVKITDRKPAAGERRCSHIMIRFERPDPPPEDTLALYAKIAAIKDSLDMGMDFADLARRNSGDGGSASRGGDLGQFGRRRFPPTFDEAAFLLKPGEVSGIVRTAYGYHLIKCYEVFPPKTWEESKKEMKQLYEQMRFQEDYKNYLAKLKSQLQFKQHNSIIEEFIAACDSNTSTRDTAWTKGFTPDFLARPMYSFAQRNISVDSVIALITARPDMNNVPLRAASIHSTLDKIAEQLVFAVKAETMDKEYPEFAAIMKEYTDGILLYQIEQERVWNSISVSDSALQWFFSTNREKFAFPDRVDFTELRFVNDSLAQLAHQMVKKGATLEDIAKADSIRMKQKSHFEVMFTSGSSKVTPQTVRVLSAVAADLKSDAALKVQLDVHPDTSKQRPQNQKLADGRLDALKAELKRLGIHESRITTIKSPTRTMGANVSDSERMMASRVDINVFGRRPMIMGTLQTQTLPVNTDERTLHADSLAVGSVSAPLPYKNSYSIIRPNKKEPARLKTFEEAGTEVSSAFQEYESKRLENEWLQGLRRLYPVTEYKEALKNAFVQIQ
jgi:peptidyl-prolyl cis-trans isomerase SurA